MRSTIIERTLKIDENCPDWQYKMLYFYKKKKLVGAIIYYRGQWFMSRTYSAEKPQALHIDRPYKSLGKALKAMREAIKKIGYATKWEQVKRDAEGIPQYRGIPRFVRKMKLDSWLEALRDEHHHHHHQKEMKNGNAK